MNDIEKTLQERGERYGEFKTHAEISQGFAYQCRQGPSWSKMDPHHREAIQMICHKLARILNGDPNYDDSWRDIAGYATLVTQIIAESNEPAKGRE